MPDVQTQLRVVPKRVAWMLAATIVILGIACIVTQVVRIRFNMRSVGLIAAFDMNREANVPTLFSTLLLLAVGFLLWVIARGKKEQSGDYYWHWKLLSIVFFYLAVDEAVGIHELLIVPLRTLLNAGGVLYFTWVIPGLAVVLGLGLYYLKFIMHLTTVDRFRFVVAGVMYVGGAIGVEMIGGHYYWMTNRAKDLNYTLITTLEESLEMAGLTLFIFALLDHMARHLPHFAVQVKNAATKNR
jgi:hypothetical protein